MDDFVFSSAEMNAIAIQKDHALRHLEAARRNFDDVNLISANDVESIVRQGYVPPVFHTLCRDKTHRLLLPNTPVSLEEDEVDVIALSAEPVEAGVWGKSQYLTINRTSVHSSKETKQLTL